MPEKSRIISLLHGHDRDKPDENTRALRRPGMVRPVAPLFNEIASLLHLRLTAETRPGVWLFAFHPRGLRGDLWLAATDAPRAAIIGSHTHADLYLPEGDGLSLRHFALLVRRTADGVRLRVIDLRTPNGFYGAGGSLRAIAATGPVVIRAGEYHFVFVPTGGPAPWASDDADPWATLSAARTEEAPQPAPPAAVRAAPGPIREETRVWLHRAAMLPDAADELLLDGESPVGHLLLLAGDSRARLALGDDALTRGVLLGREERCDSANILADNQISRVHALLFRDEGEVYVMDAGSTNGIARGDACVRLERMEPEQDYAIPNARLRWLPMIYQ